jgi:hypothetical protein
MIIDCQDGENCFYITNIDYSKVKEVLLNLPIILRAQLKSYIGLFFISQDLMESYNNLNEISLTNINLDCIDTNKNILLDFSKNNLEKIVSSINNDDTNNLRHIIVFNEKHTIFEWLYLYNSQIFIDKSIQKSSLDDFCEILNCTHSYAIQPLEEACYLQGDYDLISIMDNLDSLSKNSEKYIVFGFKSKQSPFYKDLLKYDTCDKIELSLIIENSVILEITDKTIAKLKVYLKSHINEVRTVILCTYTDILFEYEIDDVNGHTFLGLNSQLGNLDIQAFCRTINANVL